jgi:hypothetical protein
VKTCTRCGNVLPLYRFYRSGRYKDGHNIYCNVCCQAFKAEWNKANPERRAEQQRRSNFRFSYGITVVEYAAILADQGGGCAICGKPPGKTWHAVDHDHATGRVRGVLCALCNHMLGQAKDNPTLLRRAAEYLEESHAATKRLPAKIAGNSSRDLPEADGA